MKNIRNKITVAMILFSLVAGAQQIVNNSVAGKGPRAHALARGVMEEDKLHYGAAAEAYESMIEEFNRMRPRAAHAIFRLSDVNRKLGKEDEARKLYMRILREFPDFKELASISRIYSGTEAQGNGSSRNTSTSFAELNLQKNQLLAGGFTAMANAGRATAMANACMVYVRQIHGCKQQWALKNEKAEGSKISEKNISDYLRGRFPVCSLHGNWTKPKSTSNSIMDESSLEILNQFKGLFQKLEEEGITLEDIQGLLEHQKNFSRNGGNIRRIGMMNACVANLKKIAGTKEQWALENRVATGMAVNETAVNTFLGSVPQCPAKGNYTYHNIGSEPECTVDGHHLKFRTIQF
ncbi:MAG TPA: hypothetical protein EYQ50_22830 [Verrucomicrobiales bacterium]|nr:hypothetical protein [Verrucomicrobiales bacterium]